jgi:hypothetical protein
MARELKKVDWHQAYKNDRANLPGSQGQAIRLIQSFYIPLQAALALVTGRYAADLMSFKEYINATQTVCEACCQPLSRTGDGHDKKHCAIFHRAMEVLTDDTDIEQRHLLAEQEHQAAKAERIARQLANLDARKQGA